MAQTGQCSQVAVFLRSKGDLLLQPALVQGEFRVPNEMQDTIAKQAPRSRKQTARSAIGNASTKLHPRFPWSRSLPNRHLQEILRADHARQFRPLARRREFAREVLVREPW